MMPPTPLKRRSDHLPAPSFAARRQWKPFILAALPVVLVCAICLAAPALAAASPTAQSGLPLQAPSAEHLVGTDRLGRDLFSRILYGVRVSVAATSILVALSAIAGTIIGLLSGYFGRGFQWLMRVADLALAFPGIVLAMALSALVGGGMPAAIGALALVSWPKYARLARSRVLEIRDADYLRASRLARTPMRSILRWHVLPQVLPIVLVTASVDMGTLMMELAGLSFLGLGAQAPSPELGLMMNAGRSLLQSHPWIVLGPGVAMCLVVAAFHLSADALARAYARTSGTAEVRD